MKTMEGIDIIRYGKTSRKSSIAQYRREESPIIKISHVNKNQDGKIAVWLISSGDVKWVVLFSVPVLNSILEDFSLLNSIGIADSLSVSILKNYQKELEKLNIVTFLAKNNILG